MWSSRAGCTVSVMNTSAASPAPTHRSYPVRALLGAAASLLDRRVASLRCGTAALPPVEELELAARAIRKLATELERLHDAQRIAEAIAPGRRPQALAAIRLGPPVLARRGGAQQR